MRRDIWRGIRGGLCIAGAVLAAATSADGQSLREIGASFPKMLAACGVAGLVGGLLLVILSPHEQRVDRTAPRNRGLSTASFILFVIWIGLHGAVRSWARASGLGGPWVLGVSPSLFAGLAVAFASAHAYGYRPLIAGAFGAGFIILTEMIQPWLPSYTLDPWDVVAGFVGAGLAVPLLMRWPVAIHPESAPTPYLKATRIGTYHKSRFKFEVRRPRRT